MKRLAGVGSLFALTAFLAVAGFGHAQNFQPNFVKDDLQVQSKSESLVLDDYVYIKKNGDLKAKEHNVLMEGEAVIVDLLQTGNSDQYEQIAVGNGTVPANSDTSLSGRITSCGFSPADGTVSVASDGESYNVTHTFTSSCSIDINTTALEVNTGYGDSVDTFAGTDFGRTIPFEPKDQLTVKWQIIPKNP